MLALNCMNKMTLVVSRYQKRVETRLDIETIQFVGFV